MYATGLEGLLQRERAIRNMLNRSRGRVSMYIVFVIALLVVAVSMPLVSGLRRQQQVRANADGLYRAVLSGSYRYARPSNVSNKVLQSIQEYSTQFGKLKSYRIMRDSTNVPFYLDFGVTVEVKRDITSIEVLEGDEHEFKSINRRPLSGDK